MAEASKVRLVRCPKCENLLPELPDFSLYKCGGCGAVLKAKLKGVPKDRSSDASDDVKGVEISKETNTVKGTKVDMDNAAVIEDNGLESIQKEGLVSNGSSVSPAELKEAQTDTDTSRRGKERVRSLYSSDDEFMPYPQGLVRNRNRGKSCDFNVDEPEFVNFHKKNVKVIPPMDSSRSMKSKRSVTQSSFDDFLYRDEGQSSYEMNSSYGGRVKNRGPNLNGVESIENLENGRVELLRKLDELRERISQSCDMSEEKTGIRVSPISPDPYSRHAAYAREGLANPQAVNRQPYFSHSSGRLPYSDSYGSRMMDPYPQNGYPHEYLHYANSYKPEVLRVPRHQPYPGYYGDDRFMLHRHENFFHQPACSCVHCCENNWHMPPRVDLHDRRSRNEPYKPNPHPRGSNLYPPQSRPSLNLNCSDVDSENDGLNYHRPRRMVIARTSVRVTHPIGGGAPFITCTNCFELLKIPRNHISMDKNQHKLKCGACSSILLFELQNNGYDASVSTLVEELPIEIDEGTVNTDFDEFDQKFSPVDEKSNSGMVEKRSNNISSTSSPSEEEQSPGNKSSRKHDSPNQHSARDGVGDNETDVSLTAFSNSNRSQDSSDMSREVTKVSKGGESFFAGLIKKSFKKSNQGVEVGGSQVFVNGHLIPDRVVKKAEKLAGPIQPGEYWYDKQAGFWGVMGYPCLGIIMPNIEEFNYPIPKNCAAGNTGVFVNGRELHEKDLNLLASRGLPITGNRSYLVDITGKVVDEQTREELDGLGKLAPTVEKAKHGFGMKVPKFIAESKS